MDRPGVPQRPGQAAAHPATPAPACLTTNAAALACPARRPPLDLSTADQHGAMLGLRTAFSLLVAAYERAYTSRSRSPFAARPPGGVAVDAQRMRTMAELGGVRGFERRSHPPVAAEPWLSVRLLALGVDLNRYTFLDVHAPVHAYRPDVDGDSASFTQDAFDECRFVVDTALKLAEVRRGVPAGA